MNPLQGLCVFIFSWRKVTRNASTLYGRVAEHFPWVKFVNCDESESPIVGVPENQTIQLDDSCYYGKQFQAAHDAMVPGNYMACITGDVEPEADWSSIAKHIGEAIRSGGFGVFAPNVEVTTHVARNQPVAHATLRYLFSVPNTDCTCWVIHPAVLSVLRLLRIGERSNLGWGIDTIACHESRVQGLHVVRDYGILVKQPPGTGYSREEAFSQQITLIHFYNQLRQ